jgi:hypothetical protein
MGLRRCFLRWFYRGQAKDHLASKYFIPIRGNGMGREGNENKLGL